ncbi:MAG TPA: hypothetical protein VGM06_14040 [Polyangiaceae bacterium]|jgi:hypothetical protein
MSFAADLRRIVYDEERAAWDLGREELEAVGFEDWALFESLKTKRLGEYLQALCVSP